MNKQEYTDIVKKNNEVLYISIPKKHAYRGRIELGDNVRVTVEKIGGEEQ